MPYSIKIDPELDEWILGMIKKRKFRNKNHAIEYCITYAKEHMKDD